jgi:hypothetical protein
MNSSVRLQGPSHVASDKNIDDHRENGISDDTASPWRVGHPRRSRYSTPSGQTLLRHVVPYKVELKLPSSKTDSSNLNIKISF